MKIDKIYNQLCGIEIVAEIENVLDCQSLHSVHCTHFSFRLLMLCYRIPCKQDNIIYLLCHYSVLPMLQSPPTRLLNFNYKF